VKQYKEGLETYTRYLQYYYEKGLSKEASKYYVDDMGYLHKKYKAPWLLAFILSLIITSIVTFLLIAKNKMIKKATEANDYLNKETVQITEEKDLFITTHTTSYVVNTSSSSGGGFSSSGGSSGGGHSSGGGRHG